MAELAEPEQREWLSAWLRRRGERKAPIFHETHVSILAFTDDRVWKCKKAVQFPFIDLSTAAKRRANCEREVLLNRRLAPDVYLGVVPLEDDRGNVVDHLVEMRRLPESLRLSALVTHGGGEGSVCIDELADLLMQFHERVATGGEIDHTASAPALNDLWARSFEELAPFVGGVLDQHVFDQLTTDAFAYLRGRSRLFEERITSGRIRDGHGDLLADDVFCLPEGPRALDCLEFDDRLRYGDVLADVAFLAMDLERLNRHDLARRLLDRYRDRTGDQWPDSLENFYLAYRALIRAKVACLRIGDDAGAEARARQLVGLAAGHLVRARVRIVLVGGPPATGKTTVARALADLTGWPVLRSDEVRKELAGLPSAASAAAPIGRGLYTDRWSDRTYATLIDRARDCLERGSSVILDASWSSDARRAQAARLATATASDLASFLCAVDPAVADERASARDQRGDDASDASPMIAAELRARFMPWPDAELLDTTAPPVELASRVVARLELGRAQ